MEETRHWILEEEKEKLSWQVAVYHKELEEVNIQINNLMSRKAKIRTGITIVCVFLVLCFLLIFGFKAIGCFLGIIFIALIVAMLTSFSGTLAILDESRKLHEQDLSQASEKLETIVEELRKASI